MSSEVNPYQSPENPPVPIKPLAGQGMITETMLVYLKDASPWLRFIGILGFVSSGMTVLTGLSLFAVVPLLGRVFSEMSELGSYGAAAGFAFSGTMMVYCLGGGVLMFFLSLFAYRFGEKIKSYLRTGAEGDLEMAFKNNKNLWKFLGILCIISLAFIPMLIIGGVVVALAVAFPW